MDDGRSGAGRARHRCGLDDGCRSSCGCDTRRGSRARDCREAEAADHTGCQLHRLSPELSRSAGITRPTLVAELIVGTDPAVVEAIRPDGSTAWRRTLEAGERVATLRVLR